VTEFKKISENLVKAGDRQSEYYDRAKKNQLDEQLILSIFRQPLYVSGVSRPIIRRYNHIYTTIGTYYSFLMTCPGWIIPIQPGQQTGISYAVIFTNILS
jgi:hypothetical protein